MAQQKTKRSRATGKTGKVVPRKKITPKKTAATSAETDTQASQTNPAQLPRPLAHTRDALRLLVENKGLFIRTLLSAWVVLLLVIGVSQQAQYQSSREMAELYSGEVAQGAAKKTLEIGVLILSALSGGQNVGFSESQQLVVGFVYLLLWLVTIWLVRHRLAGTIVSLRDGIYNAGAPLVSTGIIGLIGLLQLLPFTIALVIYSTASVALQGTVFNILAILGLLLVAAGTVYWMLATVFAAMIVTIPGTYPGAALRSARLLVKGQRSALLIRLLWLAFVVFVVFVFGVSTTIALDRLLPSENTLFVAGMIQLITLSVSIYSIVYSYLLYRKVVDVRS